MRPAATLIAFLGCSLLQNSGAMAQAMSGAPGKPNIVGAPQSKTKIAPPPAVPGATARPGAVSPADRTAADLPPTEALFDAINRGDIITARDAVARGADIDATNLVGLTPLELSVDLSRNDITFLLLSLRNGSGKSALSQQASAQPGKLAAAKTVPYARLTKPLPATATENKIVVRQVPTSYLGSGGTATPEVGFLGFNPRK